MERHLFSRVDIPRDHIHFLNGQAPDEEAEAWRYEEELHFWTSSKGAHKGLGGMGTKGHVAFNEAIIIIGNDFLSHPTREQ